MKSYRLHIVGILTVLLGIGLYFSTFHWRGEPDQLATDTTSLGSNESSSTTVPLGNEVTEAVANASDPKATGSGSVAASQDDSTQIAPTSNTDSNEPQQSVETVADPQAVVDNYLAAWRERRKEDLASIWAQLSQCEPCLAQLAELIVNKTLEPGLTLELAIKMVALNTDTVLPVFSALIDPADNRSTAIILSEKLMKDGRAVYVAKVFDAIQAAEQSGHEKFAKQLTWVISKLENPEGVTPILDMITGRAVASAAYASHVSRIFSKTILNIPDKAFMSEIMSDYYLAANAEEKDKLWEAVSQHPDTLVLLAAQASADGQNNNMEKYANAIIQLPDARAVDGVMQLRSHIDQPTGYFVGLMQTLVKNSTNSKTLNRLQDHLNDMAASPESRMLAAEGLLAVKDNRHSRVILDNVVNNTDLGDAELISYISGRL